MRPKSRGDACIAPTCAKDAQVAADKKLHQMDIYNLDMIISIGYKESELEKAATTDDFSVVQ